jgi:hypothetical protein
MKPIGVLSLHLALALDPRNGCTNIVLIDGELPEKTGTVDDFMHNCSRISFRSCHFRAFSKCTECLFQYKLVSMSADSPRLVCVRRCKYATYLTRDFLAAFIAVQLIICCFALFIYNVDGLAIARLLRLYYPLE